MRWSWSPYLRRVDARNTQVRLRKLLLHFLLLGKQYLIIFRLLFHLYIRVVVLSEAHSTGGRGLAWRLRCVRGDLYSGVLATSGCVGLSVILGLVL